MVVGVLFVTAHSVGKVKQEKDATRTFCLVPAIDGGGDVAKPEVMRMQRMWMATLVLVRLNAPSLLPFLVKPTG